MAVTRRDGKQATWIRETKVEDILVMIKNEKRTWLAQSCVELSTDG